MRRNQNSRESSQLTKIISKNRFKETRINKTPYNMSGNELDFNKRRAGVYR